LIVPDPITSWLQSFQTWAHLNLASSPEALRYLVSRHVTAAQVQNFGIGYFPEGGDPPPNMCRIPASRSARKGTPWDSLHIWLGEHKGFEKLKGSIVFPLRDPLGGLVGFQCRQIKTKLFHRFYLPRVGVFPTMLGFPEALPHIVEGGRVILTEGLFDFLALQSSFPEAVCVMTARLTPAQAEGVLAFAREVVFLFDQDLQGRRGSDMGEELFRTLLGGEDAVRMSGIRFQRWSHPGKDLSDYLSSVGRARFEQCFREQDLGVLFRDR
jgi:DNA primase